jgi:hypothetical protein
MTINYGTLEQEGVDSKIRKGRLLVDWSGDYRSTGTVINIQTDSFYQSEDYVSASIAKAVQVRDSAGSMTWNVTVTAGVIVTANNDSIHLNASFVRTWAGGEDPSDPDNVNWLNDKYLSTGNGSGIARNGSSFIFKITEPVLVKMDCAYRVVDGIIELQPKDKNLRVLSYGSGACDPTFTVSMGGKAQVVAKQ